MALLMCLAPQRFRNAEQYVKTLMESKLILDDDMEFLTKLLKTSINNRQSGNFVNYLKIIGSIMPALIAITLERTRLSFLLFAPPVIFGATYLRNAFLDRIETAALETLIFNLKKMHRFNSHALDYFKKREELRGPIFQYFNDETKDFILKISNSEFKIIAAMVQGVRKLRDIVPQLDEDFEYLEEGLKTYIRKIEDLTYNSDGICDSESWIENIRYINNLSVLATSNFITSVTSILITNPDLNELYFMIVNVEKTVAKHCEIINGVFEQITTKRVKSLKFREKRTGASTFRPTALFETKLHVYLYDAVWHGSILLEEVEGAIEKVENHLPKTDNEKEDFAAALDTLKSQAHLFYECLDIVSDVYRETVLPRSVRLLEVAESRDVEPLMATEKPSQDSVSTDLSFVVLNENCSDQPEDEEYLLDMNAESDGGGSPPKDYTKEEEAARCLLSSVAKELKVELGRDSRFVGARRRFKLPELDREVEETASGSDETEEEEKEEAAGADMDSKFDNNASASMQPPPPPPLPTRLLTGFDRIFTRWDNSANATVRVQVNEEVFFDDFH